MKTLTETLAHYTLSELASVLGAPFDADSNGVRFSGISTDTRKIKQNDVFVALKGPNFDAHDYLARAKEKGAIAAVVQKNVDCDIAQIKVSDTLAALGQMAKARRKSFSGKVIGLTGSNGKTTVKELVASILNVSGKVLSTKGNFNNNIGLPLTLLELENDEKFAVIEMGANHSGEINYLTHITQPDVALITNAGSAHLEGFGSLEGVAKAKGEIFSGLAENGTAIINLDDNFSEYWLSVSSQYVQKTFSLANESADVFASHCHTTETGNEFILHIADEGEISITLPLSGRHNIANALVAAAAASACGSCIEEIKKGLEDVCVVSGRLTFLKGRSRSTLIDDTYNANLDSCKVAIDVLQEAVGEKAGNSEKAEESEKAEKSEKTATYFVLGDLFESGETAVEIHQEVGEYAKEKQVTQVLTVGSLTKHTASHAGEGARHFESKNALLSYLRPQLNEKSVVLVKGSRGMEMEKIVEGLVEL